MGPLIGKRSWGGVIGITNRGTLMDGGVVNVPEFGFASAEGEWVIEGYGVDPDIEVENDPKSVIEGGDPQLERAIREVMAAVEADPRPLPPRPADPDPHALRGGVPNGQYGTVARDRPAQRGETAGCCSRRSAGTAWNADLRSAPRPERGETA